VTVRLGSKFVACEPKIRLNATIILWYQAKVVYIVGAVAEGTKALSHLFLRKQGAILRWISSSLIGISSPPLMIQPCRTKLGPLMQTTLDTVDGACQDRHTSVKASNNVIPSYNDRTSHDSVTVPNKQVISVII
jgi:hypothetical protein